MAGKLLELQENTVLFKGGEEADGMYIIQAGKISIFIEQNDVEVKLAELEAGSVLGEMSFFDNSPRSASAKTSEASKVLFISKKEFEVLMQTIPAWFTKMLAALSQRLRDTNNKFRELKEEVEAATNFVNKIIAVTSCIELLFAKDGSKDGKTWQVPIETLHQGISDLLHLTNFKTTEFMKILADAQYGKVDKNHYNQEIFCAPNKAFFPTIKKFLADNSKFIRTRSEDDKKTCFQVAVAILKKYQTLDYKNAAISLKEITDSLENVEYQKVVSMFQELTVDKTTFEMAQTETGPGLKVQTPAYNNFLKSLKFSILLNKIR